MKSEVYKIKVDTWDKLFYHIIDAISCTKERQDEIIRGTPYVLKQVAKCIDADGGIFENLI
jgi:hypothetical protein